jgi:hypothetical protein
MLIASAVSLVQAPPVYPARGGRSGRLASCTTHNDACMTLGDPPNYLLSAYAVPALPWLPDIGNQGLWITRVPMFVLGHKPTVAH